MALFNLHYDTKEVVWYRQNFNVEASTPEEAVQLLLQAFRDGDEAENSKGVTRCDGDYLIETKSELKPEDNDGEATEIIYLAAKSTIGQPNELWNNKQQPDPKRILNRHGQKLFKALNQYVSNTWDKANNDHRHALLELGKDGWWAQVNIILMQPQTLEELYATKGVPANFPTELANDILHILKTGKQP